MFPLARGWWDEIGSQCDDFTSLSSGGSRSSGVGSNWKVFKQTTMENMGAGEKPDYYSVKANVVFTKKDNALYQACAGENCNKKVQETTDGRWRYVSGGKEGGGDEWILIFRCDFASL